MTNKHASNRPFLIVIDVIPYNHDNLGPEMIYFISLLHPWTITTIDIQLVEWMSMITTIVTDCWLKLNLTKCANLIFNNKKGAVIVVDG